MRPVVLALAALMVSGAQAQQLAVPMMEGPATPAPVRNPPALRLAEALEVQPMHALLEASAGAADELAALAAWNGAGRLPARNGFARPLPAQLDVRLGGPGDNELPARTSGGGWLTADLQGHAVWGTSVHVPRSHRLRLELSDVELPAGTELWVWGEAEEPIAFDLSLLAAGRTLWTPSVSGPTIYLEVALPRAAGTEAVPAFSIARVLEMFELGSRGEPLPGRSLAEREITTCMVNAACVADGTVPGISQWKKAIARLVFVTGGQSAFCTGGLLSNSSQDGTPYFLTANHCFGTQDVASTLEAFWDYIDDGCPGATPSESSVPRTVGATLLATNATSDFTFLRLSSVPGSRTFLGWNSSSDAVPAGTNLFRVSHPAGLSMKFSRSVTLASPAICDALPASHYLYADPQPELGNGATFGGSSGSPVLLANGQVVGQLFGGCGPNVAEPCLAAAGDSDVDGRLSVTYPAIAQWLSPSGGSGPCVRDAQTACLLGGRFEVKVQWTTSTDTGAAQVMSFGPERTESNESVFFYFFNPANFEMGVKVLDGCGLGGNFWIFVSGLTNQGYTVTVRDTQTGRVKTYSNPLGLYPTTVGDTSAMPCN